EALDVDRAGVDVGPDLALRADRQAVALQLDRAVDLAFDQQVLFAAQIAVDVNRRTDDRRLASTRATRRCLAPRRLRPVRSQNVVCTLVGPAFLTQIEHRYPHVVLRVINKQLMLASGGAAAARIL